MVREVFKKRIGDYMVGRTIGEVQTRSSESCSGKYTSWQNWTAQMQGTYAKVKYGQHCQTEEPVAIKVKAKACGFAARTPAALLTVLMMRHAAV